ncbi:MAG: biotin--[acetyl-CoA-carboxylase] ligase [Magnetococcales bacterium]|nr:biotin--[acetyl-CoA-carboxylase] ligase [Magnetococcales bacterium]NGZ27164.1 biotin--[acetyl-CoA-carboxylase] ligase [Magnetococcales bacterium]
MKEADDLSGLDFSSLAPVHYHYYPRLESTNQTAMAMGRQGAPQFTLVATDEQTHGRGRGQRQWVAPAGKNLSFSILLRPQLPMMQVQLFTLLAGVALAETLDEWGVSGHHLKWPNDLYIGSRKLAGILTEASSIGSQVSFLVVGVGVNVNALPSEYPPELQGRVTSLAWESGQSQPRGLLLKSLVSHFDRWQQDFLEAGFGPLRERWLHHWQGRGQPLRFYQDGVENTGVGVDLDEQGRLVVERSQGGRLAIASGEVFTMEGEKYHALGG